MMIRILGLLALLVIAGAAPLATPAAAQTLPGYEGDYDAAAAEFRAYALENFQQVLATWVDAVNRHELERALDLYADNAYVQIDAPASGRDAARQSLARWLEQVDGVRVGLGDFDASGTMAYGSVSILVNSTRPEQDAGGTMLLVLKRKGRDWEIRSQALVLD